MSVITANGQDLASYHPSGWKSWEHQANSLRKSHLFGGAMQNYQDGDSWQVIENQFVLNDDAYEAHNAALKTTVTQAGVVTVNLTVNGSTYTVEQELVKVAWLNVATKNRTDIADVTWNTPSADSNVVAWTNVIPGIDYEVWKQNGRVDNRIIFRNTFLNAAVTLFDQRIDSADIALANVICYSLVSVDGADDLPDNVIGRRLKSFGRQAFDLAPQRIQVEGQETLNGPWVRQRWVRQNGFLYCIEYMKMGEVKALHEAYPNAAIFHNVSQEFDEDDGEDTWVNGYFAETDYNYGISTSLYNGDSVGAGLGVYMIRFDLSVIPNNSILDSMRFSVGRSGAAVTSDIGHMVTTTWVEGTLDDDAVDSRDEFGATWDRANQTNNGTNDIYWTGAAISTSDWDFGPNGVYQSLVHQAGTYNFGTIDCNTDSCWSVGGSDSGPDALDLVQDWISGDTPNGGWNLWAADGSRDDGIWAFDSPISSSRPSMYLEWTEVPVEGSRRRKILLED